MAEPDLSTIHRDIGKLLQAQENSDNQSKTMFSMHADHMKVMEKQNLQMLQLQNDSTAMMAEIAEMKPHVKDYVNGKHRRKGILIGTTITSGGVGAFAAKMVEWFHGTPPNGGG